MMFWSRFERIVEFKGRSATPDWNTLSDVVLLCSEQTVLRQRERHTLIYLTSRISTPALEKTLGWLQNRSFGHPMSFLTPVVS